MKDQTLAMLRQSSGYLSGASICKTLGVELTNGGICYVGTKQAYLHKGYEINSGFYDYYAGEVIEESLIKLAAKVGRPELPVKPYDEAADQ